MYTSPSYTKLIQKNAKASGGSIHRADGGSTHSDEAADKELIKKEVKKSALTGRKDGGKTKAKSNKIAVNVIIPPRQQSAGGMGVGNAPSRLPTPPSTAGLGAMLGNSNPSMPMNNPSSPVEKGGSIRQEGISNSRSGIGAAKISPAGNSRIKQLGDASK